MEGIPNTKIVKVTSWLAIPANMHGEDVVGTEWATVLHVTSEDILSPTVVTETTHIDEPVLVEETTEKKKRKYTKRKSKTAKRTKKAMNDLKKNKRAFTKSMYGWNVKKDGSVVPNWKEQNNIDWMKEQIRLGFSASAVAKQMRIAGALGKKGGKWQSANVLRVIRNDFHNTRDETNAPNWFKNQKTLKLKP
jgi:hypothetical protein|tara:strand:- start:2296 stop:2871 length:576 start_codon:yes stop_codon:yes gene_type:complete